VALCLSVSGISSRNSDHLGYYAPRYYIDDYAGYRLPRPGWNQRWVRHYNDILVIDVRSGIVIDVIPNSYW
jgi:Ni/Co efflux regulator RcnB